MIGGLDVLRQIEAKYPALLFKQQLTAYVEKIYGMIRDNLKKEISLLLGLCIQVSGHIPVLTWNFSLLEKMYEVGVTAIASLMRKAKDENCL